MTNEITTTNGNGALMSFIERAAKDPEFDVGKFGELLRLQRDVSHDQAKRAFNQAMAAAQAEMLPVIRRAQNKHLRNRYAKLEDIDQQMRPIYTGHGFSVRFGSAPPPEPGWMRITCTVAHEGGYFEENYLDSPVTTTGSQGGQMAVTPVQAVGSTVTYLRRYLLTMVFNLVLADDDDDGEATRRVAAAATPRAERVVDPTVYDTPKPHPQMPRGPVDPNPVDLSAKPERTDEQWKAWLDKLQAAVDVLYRRAEVVEIGERASVGDALANGPQWVQREISTILATAYKRFPEEPEAELPEVAIAGESNLAAG